MNIVKKASNWWYTKYPPEMVSYWKTKESVLAKVTADSDGSYVMWMEGEKYPFPGFPRGLVLFNSLSKLKHEIKNRLFNFAWYELEKGVAKEQVIKEIKHRVLREIDELSRERGLDMLPIERCAPSVREIWRAWSVIETNAPYQYRDRLRSLKKTLCFILQEDDGYRFRVQWLVEYFNPRSLLWKIGGKQIIQGFEYALQQLEHAEVVGDMKERIRLLRRILLLVLEDKTIRDLFQKFVKEVDWNKVKLSKGDKYYFRAKWFKVDYKNFDY